MALDSYTSDPVVTRVTVVLDKPSDWYNWLQIKQDVANGHGIWEYVDPSKMTEQLPKLIEEPEPLLSEFKPDATSIAQLDANQSANY